MDGVDNKIVKVLKHKPAVESLLVSFLESILKDAKAGKVLHFAAALQYDDESYETFLSHNQTFLMNHMAFTSYLDVLKKRKEKQMKDIFGYAGDVTL